MKRHALIAFIAVVAGGAALQAQSVSLYGSNPASLPAGSPTSTIAAYYNGVVPAAMCFYTGYGSTAPIVGSSIYTGEYDITVPASTIQSIPPSAFVAGTFNASLYAVSSTSTACNGTASAAYSNSITLPILLPTVSSSTVSALPARNPNLTGIPAPREIDVAGANFLSSTTVTFSGSFTSFSPTFALIGSTGLRIDVPATLPAGATSITATVCNHTTSFDYCATPGTLPITPLITNPGTLTASPNPATTLNTVGLTAVFGSVTSGAGVSTGSVTFSEGAATLGTSPLVFTPSKMSPAPSGSFKTLSAAAVLQPVIADFNQDGLSDLLLIDSSTSYMHLLFGSDNRGGYGNEVQIALSGQGYCPTIAGAAAADFNGDGYPDLAVLCNASGTDTVYVLMNQGDGTFNTAGATAIYTSFGGTMIAAGDFNKDGKQDIVLAGPTASGATTYGFLVYFGTGTGTFPTSKSTSAAAATGSQLMAVDFNNDGYADAALITKATAAAATTMISVFQNDTTGGLGSVPFYQHSFGDGTSTFRYFPRTLPGSAYPDLVVAYAGAQPGFGVVFNNKGANIGFSFTVYTVNVPNLTDAALGDFTGDTYPDVATYDGASIQVYNSDGLGLYVAPVTGFVTTSSNLLLEGSTNANFDGYADLVTVTPLLGAASAFARNYITSGTSTATLPARTFSAGAHTLTATTPGTVDYAPGSAQTTLTVSTVATTNTLTVTPTSPATYAPAGTETLTASVDTAQTPSATGNVSFYDGSTLLATKALTGSGTHSTASFTTTAPLTGGSHTLSFTYAGDATYSAGSSSNVTYVVNKAAPVLSWTPNPASIVYGTPLSGAQLNATATVGGVAVAGILAYSPAAGAVLAAGPQTLSVTFTPTDATDYQSATTTTSITVTKATPTISWPTPADIVVGTPLSSAQLNATAAGVGGNSLPGAFTYNPTSGTVLAAGPKTLSVTFVPTDTTDYTNATGSVALNVVSVQLTSLSVTTATLGDTAKTITITGTGFVANSVVTADSAAVVSTFVNANTLTAVIPAADFLTVHSIPVIVSDPTQGQISNTLNIAVSAAAVVGATLTGPTASTSGAQPSLSFTLTNGYPVPLIVTCTLAFTPQSGLTVDPNIVFLSSGTNAATITVPANSTVTQALPLQAGTVAGTITINTVMTAGGATVTPANIQPIVIAVPAAIPTASAATITRSGNTLTVVITGFSNTREVSKATFHFAPSAGNKLSTTDLTIDGAGLFPAYFAGSAAYGSTFVYTQNFNLSDAATTVGTVQFTLVNSIGTSQTGSVQ